MPLVQFRIQRIDDHHPLGVVERGFALKAGLCRRPAARGRALR